MVLKKGEKRRDHSNIVKINGLPLRREPNAKSSSIYTLRDGQMSSDEIF